MKQLTIVTVAVAIALSCSKDKLDFDMAKDIRFQPEIEAPLINATLSLADLEERDSNLVVDPDNALRIKYFEDSLFFLSASEFVNIPEQNPLSIPLSKDLPQLESDIELGTLGGVQLGQTTFSQGSYVISLGTSSSFTTNVDVEVVLKNAMLGGVPIRKTLTLPANSSSIKDSLDLSKLNY